MILTSFCYRTIKIDYDEPVEKFNFRDQVMEYEDEEVWTESTVHFNEKDGAPPTLRIGKGKKSILLCRAKVIELTPWGAKFEAYWWAGHPIERKKDGKPKKRQKSGFRRLVRADITCEF